MRILHTADWHLGKLFYGDYLTDDQAYVLTEQLLPMIRDAEFDAVVLAGDVYDRSLPPADAVALFDEIATKITEEAGVPFFVISGNHDSTARLSFGSRMLEKQGFYIAGELEKLTGPVILHDAYGPVAFVLLPFIEPASARLYFGDDTIRSHEDALARLIDSRRGGTAMDGLRRPCLRCRRRKQRFGTPLIDRRQRRRFADFVFRLYIRPWAISTGRSRWAGRTWAMPAAC